MIVIGIVLLQAFIVWTRRRAAAGKTPLLALEVVRSPSERAAIYASAPVVMIGLIVFGIGQGSLVTLLFNVLVTASPKELAGDVGSLRRTTNNLAAAVGTAFSGALLVGLLSAFILGSLGQHPELKAQLESQVDLDNNITFMSNERLLAALERTSVAPGQIEEAVRINEESRLRALKIGLPVMAGLSLLAIFPASRLPNYKPGEIPANPPPPRPKRDEELEGA